jgi:HEAT repeat protein
VNVPAPDPRDRASILQDLASADDEVRRLAVERAPLLPGAEALPILADRLGDESWRVRKSAVECLVHEEGGALNFGHVETGVK